MGVGSACSINSLSLSGPSLTSTSLASLRNPSSLSAPVAVLSEEGDAPAPSASCAADECTVASVNVKANMLGLCDPSGGRTSTLRVDDDEEGEGEGPAGGSFPALLEGQRTLQQRSLPRRRDSSSASASPGASLSVARMIFILFSNSSRHWFDDCQRGIQQV